MVKILIATGALVAMVSATYAADFPHPQPVYPAATPVVGKAPIGKGPVGKSPIGKTPAPVVSKY